MRIVFNLYICLSENIFNYFVKTLRLRTRIRSLDQSRTRIHIFSLDPQHCLPGSQVCASFTDPDEGGKNTEPGKFVIKLGTHFRHGFLSTYRTSDLNLYLPCSHSLMVGQNQPKMQIRTIGVLIL